MILKTLTLKNYRKFKQVTLEFPDGVTGIVGFNGVGKSTIFEAIAWVLYGSVAARTPVDQIKRQGAGASDPCRVELEFVFEDDSYRIVREMTGKNLVASASLLVNGKLAATSAESVTKYIQNKLSMDFKSFFTSLFARQKELNMLSSMNTSERRPLILKMLGIDTLDDIIKEIRADKKNKSSLIESEQQNLVDESGKKKIDTYEESIKKYSEKKKDIELEIKQQKQKIGALRKKVKDHKAAVERSRKEYETINKRKEKLAEQKTQFETKNKLKIEIDSLLGKKKEREKTIADLQKKIQQFGDVEKEIKDLEIRLEKTNEKAQKSMKIVEQKKTLIENKKQDIQERKMKKQTIEKMGPDASCPTCERVLGSQYNVLIKKFEIEEQKKQREIAALVKDVQTEETNFERITREAEALKKKNKYLQDVLREKEKIETTIKNISGEIQQEQAEGEQKKKQLKDIGPVTFNPKEYTKIKTQVDTSYTKYLASGEALNTTKEQLAEVELTLEKHGGEKNLLMQQIQNMQHRITEQKNHLKRIKEEAKQLQYLSMLHELMASFRMHLISRIRPTLGTYASEYFTQLTDGKYREIELDENYNLLVYDDGNPYHIERFSGGEEDLANLCLRLAISEVITERAGGLFNFIILDEIFGSQDDIRRKNIMTALNGLSGKFRQIFLITHIEDVKNYMEHTVSVLEDERGISTVQRE